MASSSSSANRRFDALAREGIAPLPPSSSSIAGNTTATATTAASKATTTSRTNSMKTADLRRNLPNRAASYTAGGKQQASTAGSSSTKTSGSRLAAASNRGGGRVLGSGWMLITQGQGNNEAGNGSNVSFLQANQLRLTASPTESLLVIYPVKPPQQQQQSTSSIPPFRLSFRFFLMSAAVAASNKQPVLANNLLVIILCYINAQDYHLLLIDLLQHTVSLYHIYSGSSGKGSGHGYIPASLAALLQQASDSSCEQQSVAVDIIFQDHAIHLPGPILPEQYHRLLVQLNQTQLTVQLILQDDDDANEGEDKVGKEIHTLVEVDEMSSLATAVQQSWTAGVLIFAQGRLLIQDWQVNSNNHRSAAPDTLAAKPASTREKSSNNKSRSLRDTLAAAASSSSSRNKAAPAAATSATSVNNDSQQLDASSIIEHIQQQLLSSFEKELVQTICGDILFKPSEQGQQQQAANTAPMVTFKEIAALQEPKRILYEAVVLPLLMPEFFTGLRQPWKGVLLFGPPGSGKTLLAKAVASMHASSTCTFFNCSASSLVSKWRGDSEKLVKCLFTAARVTPSTSSVIFLDEVDALVSSRGMGSEHEASRRMKTEFFAQMDGLVSNSSDDGNGNSNRVMVLATTNCPWDLDTAILRRFEKRIYVPLPDLAARTEHFAMCIRELQQQGDQQQQQQQQQEEQGEGEEDVETMAGYLAQRTEGYSSADIVLICREAAMAPMRRLLAERSIEEIQRMRARGTSLSFTKIQRADFEEAFRKTKPSVPAAIGARYEQWNQLYGTMSSSSSL